LSDVGWYSEEADGDFEEKDSNFDHFLFIAPFTDVAAEGSAKKAASSSSSSSLSSSSAAPASQRISSSMLFDRFDDEILAGNCAWSFRFENQFVGLVSIGKYRESVEQMQLLFK
jgi:hypothetical protein